VFAKTIPFFLSFQRKWFQMWEEMQDRIKDDKDWGRKV
jgi:hypothetical protein